MKLLATVWYWAVFASSAPLGFVLGALVWLVARPFDPQSRALHRFLCFWCFNYLRVNPFWRARVQHRERLPEGACVFVCNHASSADVVAAFGLRTQFKFVSKASLFSLPLVGRMMRLAQYVSVERGRNRSMAKMMDDCRAWLRAGMPVLLFPEGTYSLDGRLLPFKRGAFQLALEEQVPVVPVVLRGTRGVVVGDGPWMSPRATVTVEVLAPLPPDAFPADDEALAAQVRGLFVRALGEQGDGALS